MPVELVEEGTTLVRQDQQRELTVKDVQNQVAKIQELMKEVLKLDLHYGVIPGTEKPSLLKPGAEKINLLFRIGIGDPIVTKTELPNGHRDVYIKTPMIHLPTGQVIAYGVGSCSTMESKYRYRNQSRICPKCGAEAIIKGKEEYGGGWLCWKKKGGCGAKFEEGDAAIEGQQVGKIENEDIADVYNTVLKIAAKRSYVDGTIKATAASDFFTQDVEDMAGAPETDSRHDDTTVTGKPAHTLGDRLTTLIMSPKLTEDERTEIRRDYREKCKTDKARGEFLAGWEKDIAERNKADPTKVTMEDGTQQEIPY
jgi:hypothetical protein